jgi:signal transduction histidine kinase
MKAITGLALLLLLQTGLFAQSVSQFPSTNNTVDIQQKNIDHLNDVAFDIYLEAPDSARAIAENALLLSAKSKYQLGIGRSYMNIGHVYWSQSYYPIALFYLNKALMSLPTDKPLYISNCYNIIGRTYTDLKNYKDALINLDKSEQFAHGDPDRLAEVYSERSLVYKRTGRYDEAIANANKALALNKIAHDKSNEAVLYGRLSGIYRLKYDDKAALAYSDTALKASFATHNKRLRATTYVEYAEIYEHMHDYDKAILYANKGGNLADSIGVVDAITAAYKTLISSYEGKSNIPLAMNYQKRYNKMQDSLNTFNKNKNTELIKDYFVLNTRLNDMAAAERNTSEIKEKVKWQRTIIITLSLSLIAMVIILSVTYYFYEQKKAFSEKLNIQHEELIKQKQLIEAQTTNLETLSKIKDKLLAVIAHDLRTPLANLRNISDMFDADYLTNEEVHFLMKDVNPTVKSAELTLSNLLEWAGSQMKGQSITVSQLDIFALGSEMAQTFTQALQKKNIEFLNQASPGNSVLADENHIKVVLRNLVSNAIKFTDTNGRVILNSKVDEDRIIISVEDNGKGMSADEIGKLFTAQTHFSQRGTSGESGTGIGLMLCKELVELNGGRLWIESVPGKGSTFYFSLPLNAEYA